MLEDLREMFVEDYGCSEEEAEREVETFCEEMDQWIDEVINATGD